MIIGIKFQKYDVPLNKLLRWNDANKKTKLKINELVKIKLQGPMPELKIKIKILYVML